MVEGPNSGPKNVEYTKLVAWVSKELQVLLQLEEGINATTSPDDHSSFCMEVSSFLKEMGELHIITLSAVLI